jgi:hypothetical protein
MASMRALRRLKREDPEAHQELVGALQSLSVQIQVVFDHDPGDVLNKQEIRMLSNAVERLGRLEEFGRDAEDDHGIDYYKYNPRRPR